MPIQHILLILVAVCCFAGNFVMAKFALDAAPPYLISSLRFALVSLLLLPFLKRLPRATMLHLVKLSCMLCTLHFGLAYYSLYLGLDIPTSVIVSQLGVPIACVLGAIFLKEPFGGKQMLGLTVAFVGIFVIKGAPQVGQAFAGFVACLLSAVAAGVANLWMKQTREVTVQTMLGWLSVFALPQTLVLTLLLERDHVATLASMPLMAWVSVVYTVLYSTILAHMIWFAMLRAHSLNKVTPFALLIPFISILIAQAVFPTTLTAEIWLGGALIIGGVALILIKFPRFGRIPS